ncbi:hypothetical protein MCAP1_003127 [Malassezia caprae]|uniref:Thiamine-binding protein domain-containing protein n=1 Tax=Malassezia caprae TaxID=1381934 RepID=A0AAF0IXY5_9BASI|nr:hypothetical protein MCAP1_003127 [Malassezia caprae]
MTAPTELYAVATDAVIPMGTPTTSVGTYIAECQRVLASMANEGIHYEVPSVRPDTNVSGYGTNLEGPISAVWRALQRCHEAVHAMGVERIATDIRLGTRTDSQAPTSAASTLTENQRKRESVLRRLNDP